jgi:DNA relaxase NicK
MEVAHGQVVSAGIDWITLTRKHNNYGSRLLRLIDKTFAEEHARGFLKSGFSASGYTGFKCGRLQFGERSDGHMVRLSGELADAVWWDFYQECDRVTRVDLQVTVRLNREPTLEVKRCHRAFRRAWSKRNDGPTLSWWSDSRGGATCYVGRRASQFYTRIYNKEAESGEECYERCVRYEVEIKGSAAGIAIVKLLECDTIKRGILSGVFTLLSVRGCSPAYAVDIQGSLDEPCRIPSDLEKRLRWFRSGVAPSIREFRSRGMIADAIDALGITQDDL